MHRRGRLLLRFSLNGTQAAWLLVCFHRLILRFGSLNCPTANSLLQNPCQPPAESQATRFPQLIHDLEGGELARICSLQRQKNSKSHRATRAPTCPDGEVQSRTGSFSVRPGVTQVVLRVTALPTPFSAANRRSANSRFGGGQKTLSLSGLAGTSLRRRPGNSRRHPIRGTSTCPSDFQ